MSDPRPPALPQGVSPVPAGPVPSETPSPGNRDVKVGSCTPGDAMPCDRCGTEMFRMHAVWRCPTCGFKTDCCGW